MKKPLIGIVPLVDEEKESYWMLPGYMCGIEAAGGIPVMLPLISEQDDLKRLMHMLSGILFSGGQDVSPHIYNEVKRKRCGECCAKRDEMETVLYRIAYEQDKPVLGICRGIQLINAVMGGTLYQDIPTERRRGIEHHQKPPYDMPSHMVKVYQDSPLHDLLQWGLISVNSYHHQGIKELAPGVKAMAEAEDGLIEALYVPDKTFIWAVQWHPECSYRTDENSRKILEAFVESCRG